jgi:hypothetical protein
LKFVHFNVDTKCFTLVTETIYHRDTLMYRLDKQISNMLRWIYGEGAHAEYLTPAEWAARTGSSGDNPVEALAKSSTLKG